MTLEIIRNALGWCTIINAAVLMIWLLFFMAGRDWIYRIHSRWFRISEEKFDGIHYAGMAYFKMAILVLNLVPYLALRIVG